jgi:hypothetical protein
MSGVESSAARIADVNVRITDATSATLLGTPLGQTTLAAEAERLVVA